MILRTLSALWTSVAPPMANHLWQSTLFVALAAALAFELRKNQARVRYWIWLTASVKFLIPFSLLIAFGSHLARPRVSTPAQVVVYSAVEDWSQPFAGQELPSIYQAAVSPARVSPLHWLPPIVVALWLAGIVVVVVMRVKSWTRVSLLVRRAMPLEDGPEVGILRRLESGLGAGKPIKVVRSRDWMEPGIFGVFRPVLIWPEGISQHLDDRHVEAILAHEICHARRRDNLTAVLHMMVEAIFWFHPLVWWVGARLEEERERACDEEVSLLCNQRHVYAESILRVCKFCSESPLACVSGITGADLKKRIVQIMTQRAGRKLSLGRKLILCVAAVMAVALPFTFGLVHTTQARAQSAPANPASNIAATWQGTLHAARDQRFVFTITEAGDGMLHATFYNIDGGLGGMPVISTTLNGFLLKLDLSFGTYEGTLSADGNSIRGTWRQGPNSQPLNFARATPETEWTIPQPPPRIAPMAADANPTFDVATIKPSRPEEHGPRYDFQGRRFSVSHASLSDLLKFSYGLQQSQIAKAQDWVNSESYDISAEPDGDGEPSIKQWRSMVRKLMADRFQLKFHYEKRELAAYALTVAKSGPKLIRSQGDPSGIPGLGFGPGNFGATNASVADIAEALQQGALDRPVVDQTGLTGRFDLSLRWTPDDMRSATQNADAPPDFFTAIQEQLGLKVVSTKTLVDVLVIDHVEKPSVDGAELAPAVSLAPVAMMQEKANPAPHADSAQLPAYVPTMTFDVASIRQSHPDSEHGFLVGGRFDPMNSSHLRLQNNQFFNLISRAYLPDLNHKVDGYASLPMELRSATFDLEAKADADADTKLAALTKEQVRLEQQHMMQVLLADRFHLKVHWETRDAPTYDLVVSKPGRLRTTGEQPSEALIKARGDSGVPPIVQQGSSRTGFEYMGYGATAADIAGRLAGRFGRPVNDKTGLTGKYYFHLKTYQDEASERKDDETNPWPPLETAIEDDLGLKLVPSHGPVETLVIDHAEMPTEN